MADFFNADSGKGQTILVTGGNGFVAAAILNAFLSRGYNVRTTVRSTEKGETLKKNYSKYQGQLSYAIVKDITEDSAFDEAVKGVDGVIHAASPFVLNVKDNERDLLIPAVKGTTSILRAVQKNAPQVTRVVIISSFASILDMGKGLRPGYIYNEADWNPITYDEASSPNTSGTVAYCASKAFAEKAAFDFVKENKPNFDITTICPPMVYGPAAQVISSLDHLNTSSADIYRLMNGSEKSVPDTTFYAFVDVRDVGEILARAYESPKAAGQRYLTASGPYTYAQVCQIIRKQFPQLKDKTPESEAGGFPDVYGVDNEKARKELGMNFRDLETMINDQVVQFLNLEKRFGKN